MAEIDIYKLMLLMCDDVDMVSEHQAMQKTPPRSSTPPARMLKAFGGLGGYVIH